MALYEITPTNMSGSGFFFKGRAGENMLRGKLVYKNADGAWYLADADLAAETPALGLTMGRANQGQIVRVLKEGYIGRSDWTWVVGGEIYTSGTPGELTQVAAGLVQVVGMATRPDMISFDPEGSVGAGGVVCALLEGATAYVGFDVCKGANYTNYFTVDGVADDVQINAAEAYVTALGGGTVELERGNYVLADPIIPTGNNIWYKGQGRDTFLNGDGLATTEHVFHVTGRTDIRISDMSMQTQDGGGKTCHCIFIEDGSDRFIIDNVTIVDSDSDGIHVEGTTITGGEIRNCNILDTDAIGIHTIMDAVNYMDYLIIEENTITGCGDEGMFLDDLRNGIINNNIVYDCVDEGLQLNGSTDCIVNGNEFLSNVRHGINVNGSNRCTISNNVCNLNDSGDSGLRDGISVASTSTDNIIEGNQCTGNHRHGIGVFGLRNKIVNNKCATNDRSGIYVDDSDCQVNDNDCYDNGQDAAGTYHEMHFTGNADQCLIHDNQITSPGDSSEDCIHLADGAIDVTIMNNYCFNGMGSGIALTANNDDCSIIGNRCIDNDDYGIEITAATCNDTRVKENHLEGNVTGQFLDSGTDTQTPWFFAPISDPNATLGDHPAVDMPENTDTNVYAQILVPMEFQELVTSNVIVVAAATGNMVWTVDTDFGKLCVSEAYNTHTDSGGATSALTIDELECLDISAALTAITGGDLIGVNFMRDGDDGSDNIEDSVYYMGIRVRYV